MNDSELLSSVVVVVEISIHMEFLDRLSKASKHTKTLPAGEPVDDMQAVGHGRLFLRARHTVYSLP